MKHFFSDVKMLGQFSFDGGAYVKIGDSNMNAIALPGGEPVRFYPHVKVDVWIMKEDKLNSLVGRSVVLLVKMVGGMTSSMQGILTKSEAWYGIAGDGFDTQFTSDAVSDVDLHKSSIYIVEFSN